MKNLILFLFLAMTVEYSSGQTLSPFVISPCGTDLVDSGSSQSFTLGQLAIETYTGSGSVLTQGFHQPVIIDSDCLADFNNDGVVSTADLLSLLSEYGCLSMCSYDVNDDDMVTTADLLILLSVYGSTCG